MSTACWSITSVMRTSAVTESVHSLTLPSIAVWECASDDAGDHVAAGHVDDPAARGHAHGRTHRGDAPIADEHGAPLDGALGAHGDHGSPHERHVLCHRTPGRGEGQDGAR